MLDEKTRYKILKLLADDAEISQRALADALGISLGKVNYCLNALVEKGFVKVRNFRNSRNKVAYAYYLTPHGIEEKARVTLNFFKRKLKERDDLVSEIEQLRNEVASLLYIGEVSE